MNIIIENNYENPISVDYEKIISSVINESEDYVNCPYECEVNVSIVDIEMMKQINLEQRKINAPTDVLSFPLIEYEKPADFSKVEDNIMNFNPENGTLELGDIVICYDKVILQAKEYNHSEVRELAFLTAHSMLHLFGFDHMDETERETMEDMQDQILKNLGITRDM